MRRHVIAMLLQCMRCVRRWSTVLGCILGSKESVPKTGWLSKQLLMLGVLSEINVNVTVNPYMYVC